jgi:plasmid stabilization system protein ParE
MPQFAVEFHPLGADEAEAAERWYRERNEIASVRFQWELDRAVDLISERPNTGSPYLGDTRRLLLRRFHSSSCIAYEATTFRSSPSRMRGGDPDTGERVDRRFQWFEKPSLRPHIGSHSQLHGDELSPDFAKALTSSGLLRTLERYFTIERRGRAIGESRGG